ncbi:cytidylate kinase family protein [Bacteroidota bacterium]
MGIITISRGSYSKGKEIAQSLAQKLGYECISREILLETSKEFNIPEVKLMNALEDAPSVFERLKQDKRKYVAFIREAFLEHIQGDNVIYHGFAGHYFTKNIQNVLKIRIIANINYRIKYVMKKENVSKEKARTILFKIDAGRLKWGKYLYGIDTNSPELYDIVLRIDCLNVNDSVETLYDIAKCPCFQTTPESKQKLKDMLLAARVYSILVDKFPYAKVDSNDGVVLVTIESSLSYQEKIADKIENLLKNVDGIKSVKTNVIPFNIFSNV